MANYNIADILVSLKRNNISYNLTNKVVFTPMGQPIGISLLGKIDFLVNHNGWHCEKVMPNESTKAKKPNKKKKFNREDKKEQKNFRSHKAHNEQKNGGGKDNAPKPKAKRSNSKPKAKVDE